ncbi:MAG TPA: glycosyltransferase [Candidatus Moranbacteria bacterium]|nr:glycosyltransferase [Candidatus Moranbacteria bacterium]
MPKFSVLIPIIKGKFLSVAIDSVLKQTFSDWELVLYNDCSLDDIDSIVKRYESSKIRYVKGEKNIGKEDPTRTWNKMLEMAKGEFICLLGDDDYIAENFLEEINRLILKYPKVSLFRTKVIRVDEENKKILEGNDLPEFETWDQMLFGRNVTKRLQSTSEFVIKKEALNKIGGYVNFPRACGSDDVTYLMLAKDNGVVFTNKARAYWRKSSLNISDNDSKETNFYKLRFFLEWEKNFLDNYFSQKVPLSDLYKSIDDYLGIEEKDNKEKEFNLVKTQLDSTKSQLDSVNNELLQIHSSYSWRINLLFQKFINFLLPPETSRRKAAISVFFLAIDFIKVIIRIKSNIFGYFLQCKNYFIKLKPRKKRKINKNSRKLVFIGHSYHNKTKSTVFLIEYLKKFFDVEEVLDESWIGKPFPDLSFIDESYLGVIFFQLLPSRDVIRNIKNDNIIFFPMYDQSGRLDFGYWNNCRDLKIINFSKTLHEKLAKWGFESMFVQYFTKPDEFIPGDKNEVFFWQRLTKININIIAKIFGSENKKIHIHKAVDPYQKFIQPSEEDERKYQITYSEWFESRKEMWDVIKQKGIYVAPREFEGIGMSFLEAMAMGKAVIAVNNPTMNEYIENGKNGYLFDFKKPGKIDLSNIEEVQKNAYEYMQKGYEQWEKEKIRIVEFIKKP